MRLAPIDDFFLLDDRPTHPMTFTSHLYFTGDVCRDAFTEALEAALLRHPLLIALVKPLKGNRPCWVSSDGLRPEVHWGKLGELYELRSGEGIDLTKEVGLRIWVRRGNERSEILLQFHHSCCDGTGAYRFIGDLLAEYGRRTAAEGAELPELEDCDPQLLRQRRLKMARVYVDGRAWTVIRKAIGHGWKVFCTRVTPMAAPHQEVVAQYGPQMPFPGVQSYQFSKQEHLKLRAVASEAGVMLNDLLMAEMFRVLKDWNIRHGQMRQQQLRIMMPTDLRDKEDLMMPAANMTAYSYLTRRARECVEGVQFLRGIRDETALIKHERRGQVFIDAIMSASRVPGLLKFLLNRRSCLATMTLSNVGDPTRRFLARFPRQQGKIVAGNLVLDRISGVPPLRPMMRGTVAIVTYCRELAINIRCDPQTITAEDARELLDAYAARLRSNLA
ncbi:MAG: hypothetical protein KDA60_14085 [Planctomycetales bacterium]|nr:hypothetical protein [Planctomycetales bacterium]